MSEIKRMIETNSSKILNKNTMTIWKIYKNKFDAIKKNSDKEMKTRSIAPKLKNI